MLSNICKIFLKKANKQFTRQVLLLKVKIDLLEKLESEKNDSFSNLFDIPKNQTLINVFPCIYVRLSKTSGALYIFNEFLCFKGFSFFQKNFLFSFFFQNNLIKKYKK